MNKKSNKIFLMLFLLSGITLAAVPDTSYKTMEDTAFFNNRLRTYNAGLTTIECDFVQKKYMSILSEPVVSNGNFCYKNGVMIRWEYTEPFKYLIVINNGRMSIKDDEKANSYDLTASDSFNKLNTILGKILQGNVLNEKNDFTCSYYENDLNFKLVLTPGSKDIKAFFKNIVLFFEKKMFSVARVQLNEVSGDVTDIWFNNRKINGTLSDDLFLIK